MFALSDESGRFCPGRLRGVHVESRGRRDVQEFLRVQDARAANAASAGNRTETHPGLILDHRPACGRRGMGSPPQAKLSKQSESDIYEQKSRCCATRPSSGARTRCASCGANGGGAPHGICITLIRLYGLRQDAPANLLAAACCHDLSEAATGDIPANAKRDPPLKMVAHNISSLYEQKARSAIRTDSEEASNLAWADFARLSACTRWRKLPAVIGISGACGANLLPHGRVAALGQSAKMHPSRSTSRTDCAMIRTNISTTHSKREKEMAAK